MVKLTGVDLGAVPWNQRKDHESMTAGPDEILKRLNTEQVLDPREVEIMARKRPSKRIGGPAGWKVNEILDSSTAYRLMDLLEAINLLIETSGPENEAYVQRQLVGEHYPEGLHDGDKAKVNAIVQGRTADQLCDLLEAIDLLIETPGPERDLSMRRAIVGRWIEDDCVLPGALHWDPQTNRWGIYPGDRWSS